MSDNMNKCTLLSNLKFKAIFLSVLLVVGLIVQFTNLVPLNNFTNLGVKSVDAWYSDFNYGYKKALMIDNAQVIGGSTLTDFPVLLSFTDSSLRTTAYGGRVRNANGFDIVFTEQGGSTKLDHEIESYNQTTGAITMWVKVPNLYACCATQLDMYYGNPNISTSQENKTGVWSNGYAGVWHLGANLNDSTSNSNNGTNVGATTAAEGKVGNGISTNGSTGRVTVADHATLRPSTNLTISAWIKRSGAQDSWGKPIWYGYASSPPGTYGLQLNNTSDDITGIQIAQSSPSSTYSTAYNSQNLNDATWRFIAGTYNGSSLTPFFDGSAGTPVSTSITINHYPNSYGLGMGGRFEGVSSDAFLGNIDEVRISLVARTTGWITTEYNTVQNQGSGAGKFISSIGGEETPPVPAIAYPQSSAIDNTSALVGAGVLSYVSSPTVIARWGTTNGSCSGLPNTVSATGSNRTDVNNYVSYTARITGLPPGQPVYWCLQATTSNGPGYLTTQPLNTQATAATGCDLLPGSTLASSGDKTTLAGYLGTSKLKGTLLYKATTNGWTASNFHTAVNNQGETIVLVRNSANSKIFGGYAPQSFTSSGSHKYGSNAFLFNLSDGYQLKQFMSVYQIYDNANYGPTFGGAPDLAFPNSTLNSAGSVQYTSVHSYEYPSSKGAFSYLHGGTSNQYFVPNEIEVYKIDTCTTSTPVLSLPTNTSPTYTTVTLGATVDSDGGAAIFERGVCYALTTTDSSPGFTTATGSTPEAGVTCQLASAVSPFTVPVTDLIPNKGYTYRGYARNVIGNGYSSTGTFTTPNNGPASVTTTEESGLASYKVTFNGSANPNGSEAYGYFRYYTSVPDCTLDSGGTRMPSSSAADKPLGSGSSPVDFNYTTPTTVLLTPNTNYWYCAYSRNTAAGAGAPGTPSAAGYDTFITPDGGASGCDAPASGDITITEACTFPQSDSDGVDSGGSGTTNTARIILNSGGNITVLPGQRIARGSLQTNGGSFSIGNGGGSVIRGGVWIKDSDGDGIIDFPVVKTVSNTQPAGYVRRNHLYTQPTYNNSTFNYASKMYNVATTSPSNVDCDSNSANVYRYINGLVTDQDNDGYKTSAAAWQQCVGANTTINTRTYYTATSGATMWLPDAQKLSATTDCQDNASGAPCAPVNGSGTDGSNPTAAAATTTQINLSWGVNSVGGAVPAVTGYDVQICGLNDTTCASVDSTVSLANNVFSYSNSGITCSTSPSYYYRIVAKNTTNGNTNSNVFSGVTSSCASAPSVTTSAASGQTTTTAILNSTVNPNNATTSITYRWQTGSTATCNASTPTNPLADGPSGLTGGSPLSGATTQQTLGSLSAGTRYYYCATANNSFGTIYGTVQNFWTLPSTPTSPNAAAQGYEKQINLTWNQPTGATGYNIYACSGSGCTPTLLTSVGSTNNYQHTNLTCATLYRYQIAATNSAGEGAKTSIFSATVASGSSVSCYRDADDDGSHVSNTAVSVCSPGICDNLSGWEGDNAGTLDCYDLNAQAYPGQSLFNGDGDGGGWLSDRGDNSWDYNCDTYQTNRKEEINPGTWRSCTSVWYSFSANDGCVGVPMCASTSGGVPACGSQSNLFNVSSAPTSQYSYGVSQNPNASCPGNFAPYGNYYWSRYTGQGFGCY